MVDCEDAIHAEAEQSMTVQGLCNQAEEGSELLQGCSLAFWPEMVLYMSTVSRGYSASRPASFLIQPQ